MATLLNELERTGGRYGLQTMCEGGGMANATIIERSGLIPRAGRRRWRAPARVPGAVRGQRVGGMNEADGDEADAAQPRRYQLVATPAGRRSN